MYTCPLCQAVYFVNFEGQAEFSENVESDFFSDAVVDEIASADPVLESFVNPMAAFEHAPLFEAEKEEAFKHSEFSQVASEITDFGNSDAQIASLNYDVEIAGLDSKEEVLAFREAIDDIRFGWEIVEMMKRLHHGIVKIEKLNPVQAFILSKRIRFLKAEVKWKQNVLA